MTMIHDSELNTNLGVLQIMLTEIDTNITFLYESELLAVLICNAAHYL